MEKYSDPPSLGRQRLHAYLLARRGVPQMNATLRRSRQYRTVRADGHAESVIVGRARRPPLTEDGRRCDFRQRQFLVRR